MRILEKIKESIPFQLKRGTSIISILLAIVAIGALERLGSLAIDLLWTVLQPHVPRIINLIVDGLTYRFEVNVITLILFVILIFPLYNFIDRTFLKVFKTQVILRDRTFNGWYLNYWGTTNPEKTIKVLDGKMIFEATPEELLDQGKHYGAFLDLRNGIYEGNKYEISCKVKSDNNCTMKFQLWVHDTVGGSGHSILEPTVGITPKETEQTIRLTYLANNTNSIRIHLHNEGGQGRILVSEVLVKKVG